MRITIAHTAAFALLAFAMTCNVHADTAPAKSAGGTPKAWHALVENSTAKSWRG